MTNPNGHLSLFAGPSRPTDVPIPTRRWLRFTSERIALTLLVDGGSELIDAAIAEIRPSYFDGGRRVICGTMLAMRREGVDVNSDALAARLQGKVAADELADFLAACERTRWRPPGRPEPLWLKRAVLMDFIRDIRREETALYFWFDAEDVLLYIGITGDLATRQSSHAKRSSWSEFADHSKVRRFPSRPEAEAAEKAAIEADRPLFNRVHNDTPEARQRLVAYLIEHGRADLLTPAVSRG